MSIIFYPQLKKGHLKLFDEIVLLGQNVIEVTGNRMNDFKMGFHLSPSMHRLHMHVISLDFDSQFLKTKKHWNSFNTDFFIPAEKIRDRLEIDGFMREPDPDYIKQLLKTELKCNKCEYEAKNMPDIKAHIQVHSMQLI